MDLSPMTFGMISFANPQRKNTTNSQIIPGTTDENKKSKVLAVKI